MEKELQLEYNTQRGKLIISEYGRNIQKMVEVALQTVDHEKRKQIADELIQLMGQLNPHLRDIADYKHKLYDHLFIISDFKLDIESPYPKPTPETIQSKPDRLPYPVNKIAFRFYGKSIERMIVKVTELEDGPFKTAYINSIGSFMKTSCRNWNDEMLTDEQIMAHLEQLSDGKIKINAGEDIQFTTTQESRPQVNRNQNNRNFRNNNQNQNRNRNRNTGDNRNSGTGNYKNYRNKPR